MYSEQRQESFGSKLINRRKTFATSTKPKYTREVVSAKEHLPSPVKRPRMEVYEERRVKKPIHKVIESKPANPVKVIEKKPQLYTAAAERPLPQRKVAQRKSVHEKRESKSVDDTNTKPVAKKTQQESKEAPAVKKNSAEVESEISPEDTKPYVKPNNDGQYELDPVSSSVLDDELQQLMIKVWQELPDAPPTDAERLVANKFRNEAGDDLQNAMGLSVTSRLLNVHNPLYVKLHFSGKPEAGRLQAFIREYKITAFKRIGDSFRDTFAARFDRIADFDRFCVHDQVKCGSATVTITPCYKYLSCPPSVKTIYADNIAKTKTQVSTNSSPQKQTDNDKEKTENTKTGTKEVARIVKTEADKSETQVNTAINKTATTVTNAKEAVKAVPKVHATEKPNVTNKTATTVTNAKETVKAVPKVNATETPNATNKTATTVTNAKEAVKAVPKVNATEKPNATNKTATTVINAKDAVKAVPKVNATEKPNATNKTATTVINAKDAVKAILTVNATEQPNEIKDAKEAPAEVKKVTPKKEENKKEPVNKDVVDKIKELDVDVIDDMMVVDEMGEEDDEEMTDQDILALMSGGIVLDECSGSDDEK